MFWYMELRQVQKWHFGTGIVIRHSVIFMFRKCITMVLNVSNTYSYSGKVIIIMVIIVMFVCTRMNTLYSSVAPFLRLLFFYQIHYKYSLIKLMGPIFISLTLFIKHGCMLTKKKTVSWCKKSRKLKTYVFSPKRYIKWTSILSV